MKQMMKAILLVMVCIGFSGCAEGNIGELHVSTEDTEIKSVLISNPKSESPSSSSSNSEESEFRYAFEQESSEEIQYVKIGETVTLDFGDHEPDTISLKDSVLNKSGDVQYSYRETLEVPLTKKDGKYNFRMNKHIASALSSGYKENKKDYRGFNLTATWGQEEYRYAFVIQADAY